MQALGVVILKTRTFGVRRRTACILSQSVRALRLYFITMHALVYLLM